MSERSPQGVTLSNVVILATDEVTVIGTIPASMDSAKAQSFAQVVYDRGMLNKEHHYDRCCRDDYDIETFFEEQLEKHGFAVINTRTFYCD
jgi:hypothetical protein